MTTLSSTKFQSTENTKLKLCAGAQYIHLFQDSVKNYKIYFLKKENINHTEYKNWSIETDPKRTELTELIDKNIKQFLLL